MSLNWSTNITQYCNVLFGGHEICTQSKNQFKLIKGFSSLTAAHYTDCSSSTLMESDWKDTHQPRFPSCFSGFQLRQRHERIICPTGRRIWAPNSSKSAGGSYFIIKLSKSSEFVLITSQIREAASTQNGAGPSHKARVQTCCSHFWEPTCSQLQNRPALTELMCLRCSAFCNEMLLK